MLGLFQDLQPRFVKQYADLRTALSGAALAFSADVVAGTYLTEE